MKFRHYLKIQKYRCGFKINRSRSRSTIRHKPQPQIGVCHELYYSSRRLGQTIWILVVRNKIIISSTTYFLILPHLLQVKYVYIWYLKYIYVHWPKVYAGPAVFFFNAVKNFLIFDIWQNNFFQTDISSVHYRLFLILLW